MAAGIIAEYNPFHAGHEYQISAARKIFDGEIVAVMSGSFTQRGTPAILDKWTRAAAAVEGSADLVLELPFSSAVRSAQDFARGGVKLLAELGVVNALIFGAETSELRKIQSAAKIFDEKFFPEKLKSEMSSGISYAAAAAKILAECTGEEEKFFSRPNIILATEYLRALPKNFKPILIPRVGAEYDELTLREKFSSAAAIRAAVREKNPDWEKISQSVNKKILRELQAEKKFGFVREEFLFRPLLAKIFSSRLEDLQKIFGMREGLEFLLLKSAKSAKNFSELLGGLVNKRYPASRIRRLLLHVLLGVTEEKISELAAANFVRVLAFNERGQKLLKKISSASNLPIVTKVTKHLTERDLFRENFSSPYKKNLALDLLATNLRGILFPSPRAFGRDFSVSPKKIFQ